MWVLASQGLDYRTTKEKKKPKTIASLKDYLSATDKELDLKPEVNPKVPKNHEGDELVYNGPFGEEHADLLVMLLKSCSSEVMVKLQEMVRNLTKEAGVSKSSKNGKFSRKWYPKQTSFGYRIFINCSNLRKIHSYQTGLPLSADCFQFLGRKLRNLLPPTLPDICGMNETSLPGKILLQKPLVFKNSLAIHSQ